MNRKIWLVLTLMLSWPGLGVAQMGGAAPLFDVQVVTLKPGCAAEWEALQLEMNRAMRAGDAPGREFWQIVTGELDTYYTVSPIEAQAPPVSYMTGSELQSWTRRVEGCIAKRRSMVWSEQGRIATEEGKQHEVIVIRKRVAKSGRSHDLEDWYNERLYPALRDVGDEGRFYAKVIMGGSTDTYYAIKRLAEWEAVNLPEPLEGVPNVRQLFADLEDILAEANQDLALYREDLSF